MKLFASALIAAVMLTGSSVAMAQHHDHGDRDGHGWHDDRGDHGRGHDRDRREYGRYDHDHDRRRDHDRHWVPPGHRHHWVRGHRYYGPTYVVRDYRTYRLRPPPRGYHWVRDDDGQYLLVAIATGIILDIALH